LCVTAEPTEFAEKTKYYYIMHQIPKKGFIRLETYILRTGDIHDFMAFFLSPFTGFVPVPPQASFDWPSWRFEAKKLEAGQLINLIVSADIDKQHSIFINKFKNYPVIIINAECP